MKFTTSCPTFLFKLVVVVSYILITGLHTVLDMHTIIFHSKLRTARVRNCPAAKAVVVSYVYEAWV